VPIQDFQKPQPASETSGLLALRGTGRGLWGADVGQTIADLRDEWGHACVKSKTPRLWSGLAEVLTGPFKAGHLAAQLRVQYRLKLPDAIQLATGLDIGAAAFVTHDRDFSQVSGVEILMGERGSAA
jgi:hypothetical protein